MTDQQPHDAVIGQVVLWIGIFFHQRDRTRTEIKLFSSKARRLAQNRNAREE